MSGSSPVKIPVALEGTATAGAIISKVIAPLPPVGVKVISEVSAGQLAAVALKDMSVGGVKGSMVMGLVAVQPLASCT